MKPFFRLLLFLLPLGSIMGCNSSIGSGNGKSLLAKASSEPGEIILVMDTLHRNTELGTVIKETFQQQVQGLPRPEPIFTVRYINPLDFRSILKFAENIVIVTVLDNYSSGSERVKNFFTPSSLKKIKEDTSVFLLSKQDEWARGQEILYLFGKDEATLIKHITENKEKLQAHFNNIERKRIESSIYAAKELKEVGNLMMRNHDCSIRLPFGWRIDYEAKESNFIWLRNPGLVVDKNIWIYYEEYTDQTVFDDIIKIRNSVTKKYIFDDREKNDTSYVVVETIVPPTFQKITFKNKFAVEARGLWKTKNLSMGGPFVSYVFVDESLGRLYYVDGFIYSPGKPQREYMRELEAILWTFKTKNESDPGA